jgi:hypothetical protein
MPCNEACYRSTLPSALESSSPHRRAQVLTVDIGSSNVLSRLGVIADATRSFFSPMALACDEACCLGTLARVLKSSSPLRRAQMLTIEVRSGNALSRLGRVADAKRSLAFSACSFRRGEPSKVGAFAMIETGLPTVRKELMRGDMPRRLLDSRPRNVRVATACGREDTANDGSSST